MGPFGVRSAVGVEGQQVTQVSVEAVEAEVKCAGQGLGDQEQQPIYPPHSGRQEVGNWSSLNQLPVPPCSGSSRWLCPLP